MKIKNVKDVGMGLGQYVDLCLRASFLLCLHTFWHAIPTSFYNHVSIEKISFFGVNLSYS